jgi:hypothetical protein
VIGFQFQVDCRPAGPIRLKWKHAAQDAVDAGYGSWKGLGRTAVKLDSTQGAAVARIELDSTKT